MTNGKGKDKVPAGGKKVDATNIAAGKKRGRESVIDHVSLDNNTPEEKPKVEKNDESGDTDKDNKKMKKEIKKGKKELGGVPKAKKARESISEKVTKLEEGKKEREIKASESKKGRAARAAARSDKADVNADTEA